MGRGNSGRAKRAGGASGLAKLLNGKYVEGDAGEAAQAATELLQAAQNAFDDFGMSGFTAVRFHEDKGSIFRGGEKAIAGVNGLDQLTINKKAISKPIKDSNGYLVSDTPAGHGAHEAGHAIVNGLLKTKVAPNASNLEKANARKNQSLEKTIIKEAKKRYGSNPVISGYGSTKPAEKVAEAFSDVYANKKKAKPYSKVIVEVCKDINSGKFKPNIRLSNKI